MQTDKELFDLIKESYPLNPREDFVRITSNKLRKRARKLDKKRRMHYLSIVSTSIAACAIAFSLIFVFEGKDLLTNNLIIFGQEDSMSSATIHEPLVYIYHSHNLESFFSESKSNEPDLAFHESNNISLVGERLRKSLTEKGINSIHDKTDITSLLKENNLPFSDSYRISREPLITSLNINRSIKMVFDIHRDSQKRNTTTIMLNGKEYSRVAFIVSRSSANYDQNYKIAELFHNKIEEKYPRLSRGVFIKNNEFNQNTYNQDLFGSSVLLEIGGYENTLQEEYRTADVLAEIIQDILKGNNE